ncbi:MAG: FAD-linked oxidase C-terminal domain-containing protein [Thermodesulfobacteriota bacterium]|nr:FAD-linked oxidase C-terminal domain-containing protein [Thermodesulfobacteriota bacterium]
MKKEIIKKLRACVGKEHLLTVAEELACYSFDGTGQSYMPDAVVLPDSAEQIAALLTLANQYRFPVVPRGAGSGMTGGALPVKGGLVIGLSRMNRILEIDGDNMIAVVEPGVITGELQAELKKQQLMYPPDPASLKFCSIGGNAAECAGGPSAVKYGVTRDYIIGLEVVLPTGEIMKTGVRTEKGVVGYDLTHLFIGSEGTLGIFTKLILRLLPLPESKTTFLLSFSSLAQATGLVAEIMSAGLMPCTLEYMDKTAVQVVRDQLAAPPHKDTAALLLVEFDGFREEVEKQSEQFTVFVQQHEQKGCSLRRAADEAETAELWQARRSISPATLSLRPNKISEDVVVPRSKIPDLVAFTDQLTRELNLIILTFGHAGDGNIHVNIMVDKNNEQEYADGIWAKQKLFEFVLSLNGTLSGEHGIGTTKSEFLPMEIDRIALSIMKRLKTLFDPNNILNPGKIFPDRE